MFFKMLKTDVRLNIVRKVYPYILMLLITLYECIEAVSLMKVNGCTNKLTFSGLWTYLYRGMEEYIPSPSNPFEIPVTWLLFYVLLIIIHFSGLSKNNENGNIHLLTQIKNRWKWVLYKMQYAIVMTGIYYGVQLLAILVFCLIMRIPLQGQINPEILMKLLELTFLPARTETGLLFYAMPVLFGFALAIAYTGFSLIMQPIVAFLEVMIILIISAYYMSPYVIGNYGMFIRNRIVMGDTGVGTIQGIILMIVFVLVVSFVSVIGFKRKDIFKEVI